MLLDRALGARLLYPAERPAFVRWRASRPSGATDSDAAGAPHLLRLLVVLPELLAAACAPPEVYSSVLRLAGALLRHIAAHAAALLDSVEYRTGLH